MLRRLLSSPRALVVTVVLAVLAAAPALFAGHHEDDFLHLAALQGDSRLPTRAFDLYRFATGDPRDLTTALTTGTLPWWTAPTLKLAFPRPLASAHATLEYALFGPSPLAAHALSLAWYAALVVAAGVLLRRALPGALGALALLLFALDDAHWMPVGYAASRHALMAGALGLAGVALHVRGRATGTVAPRALALLLFALALSAGLAA